MKVTRAARFASLALPLLWLGSAPGAGPAGGSDSRTKDDIAFARGLAARFRYIDMAEELIAEIEAGGVSDDVEEELGLVKCDIFADGARREGKRAKRTELYQKAIDSYQSFIKKHSFSDLLPKAERSYVDLANRYAQDLKKGLGELAGDEARTARESITQTLEAALKTVDAQLGALEGQTSQAEAKEKYTLQRQKGQMYLTLGSISPEGIFYLNEARSLFEELVFEHGEQTPRGLYAFLDLAKVNRAAEELDDAAGVNEFVLEFAMPSDAAERSNRGWTDAAPGERDARMRLAEQALVELLPTLLEQGKLEDAVKFGLHLHNRWKEDGLALTPNGHLGLIEAARALVRASGHVGGSVTQGTLQHFDSEQEMRAAGFTTRRERRTAVDLALSIAQFVNDENKGNLLQVQAQKLISDAIQQPGMRVSPDVLLQAAEGEYNSRNYIGAVDGMKRVLAALEESDEAERKIYGPKVCFFIGRSWDKLGRPLEAAVAFREGVTTWRGDPEYDNKNAKAYYDSSRDLLRKTPKDSVFQDMRQQAENLVVETQSEGSPGDILKTQGDRLRAQGAYEKARAKYLEVERGDTAYEESLVKASYCLYKQGSNDAAAAEFRRYLEEYVPDPENALSSPAQETGRQKASAQARYTLGTIAFNGKDPKGVIKWLQGFSAEFPGQTEYGVLSFFMLIRAHIAGKDLDAAKAEFEKMVATFPKHKRTGVSSYDIYKKLKLLKGAADEAKDAAASRSLAAEGVRFVNARNNVEGLPHYGLLREESSLWLELENWPEAERVLRDTVSAFLGDEERGESLEKYVYPDLGQALAAQQKVPDAFSVLESLIPDPDDKEDLRKPPARVVHLWCRTVSGWVEGDGREVVEVPGVGGEENFAKAAKLLIKLTGREEKWTCPWYELKFDTIYAYLQWGKLDSAKRATAARLIDELTLLMEDPNFGPVAEACGNDQLQQRFLWLARKVR